MTPSLPEITITDVVLDLGGVVVELTGGPLLIGWSQGVLTAENLLELWLLSPSVRRFEVGAMTNEQFGRAVIEEFRLQVGLDEFLTDFALMPRRLFPGTVALLEALGDHARVSCLTNTNALHWPRLMETLGLRDYFQHLFASHLTGLLKPDPGAFQNVIDCLGVHPDQMVFIDDSPLNVAAATRLGIRAFEARGADQAWTILQELSVIVQV